MSYSLTSGAWEVRWRDGDGRQRSRRFDDEPAAQAFDEAIHDQKVKERKSDEKWTQKRGFTSPSSAANWRRRQLERVERREVVHTRESFGEFFPRWLTRRKPYLEDGSWRAYERDGRIRLLPALESVPLGRMEVEHVRDLMDVMTESMEAGEIAPKTVNNKGKVGSTKSDRFRAVEVGPGLSAVVREQVEKRAAMPGGDKLDALLYTMPVRVRKTDQGRWEGNGDGKPFDRTTVSRDWHKAALQDADLRDRRLA